MFDHANVPQSETVTLWVQFARRYWEASSPRTRFPLKLHRHPDGRAITRDEAELFKKEAEARDWAVSILPEHPMPDGTASILVEGFHGR